MIRKWVKGIIKSIIIKSIIARRVWLGGSVEANRGILIVMYHEVAPRHSPVFRHFAELCTTPETFARQVEWLAQHFEVISLDEAVRRLQDGTAGDSRAVVLTSDDGWMGFHQHALPVLHQRGFPATVYVPTDVLGGRPHWPVRWGLLLARNRWLLKDLAHELGHFEPFPSVGSAMRALRGLDVGRIEHLWRMIVEQYSVQEDKLPRDWFINEDGVREMVARGIMVGAHTVLHPMLTREPELHLQWELTESRRRLQEICGREVVHFAYPFGDHDDRVVNLVRDAGYRSAVTTDYGWNLPGHDVYRLRRVDVRETACEDHRGRFDEALFALWVTGEWERIRRRLKFLQ